jgi:hypothetical protein
MANASSKGRQSGGIFPICTQAEIPPWLKMAKNILGVRELGRHVVVSSRRCSAMEDLIGLDAVPTKLPSAQTSGCNWPHANCLKNEIKIVLQDQM